MGPLLVELAPALKVRVTLSPPTVGVPVTKAGAVGGVRSAWLHVPVASAVGAPATKMPAAASADAASSSGSAQSRRSTGLAGGEGVALRHPQPPVDDRAAPRPRPGAERRRSAARDGASCAPVEGSVAQDQRCFHKPTWARAGGAASGAGEPFVVRPLEPRTGGGSSPLPAGRGRG